MTTIRAAAAEELYADGEGTDGDTIDGWTLVGGAQDHKERQSRWHQQYWLVVENAEGETWGVGYGIGLTENQENDFPWEAYTGDEATLPLTRLHRHVTTSVKYSTKPAAEPTAIEAYAVKLVAVGAEGIAEDDMDEDGEFENEEDAHAAGDLGVDMAKAIGQHPASFLAWYRSVSTDV